MQDPTKIQIARKLAKNKKYAAAIDTIRHILIENFADTKPIHMKEIAGAILEEEIPQGVFRSYYYRHIKPIIDNKKAYNDSVASKSKQKVDTIANSNEIQQTNTPDEKNGDEIIEEYKDVIESLKFARELQKKMNKEEEDL